jgi:hypothetical protein
MSERPFRFSLAAVIGAVSLAAVVFGIARLGGERTLWGTLSVVGLCGLGAAIAVVGGRFFGLSIAGGSAVALSGYLLSGVVAEEYHGILLQTTALLVWGIWAVFAVRGVAAYRLLQMAMGLAWGFLVGTSLLISVQNARVSVNWPAMIPALILAPLAFFLPILPFWITRRWLWPTRSRRPMPCDPPGTVKRDS